jgi:hypothetical protein
MKRPLRGLFRLGALLGLGMSVAGVAAAQPSPPPGQPQGPATGQNVTPPPGVTESATIDNPGFDRPAIPLRQREDNLAARLDAALAEGSIDRKTYDRAKATLDQIRADEDRLRGTVEGDLTGVQTSRLEHRIHALAASIHWGRGARGGGR